MAGQDGHCLCGATSFSITGAPLWSTYCHCQSCRRHTGAPVTQYVGFKEPQVVFHGNDFRQYASSPGVLRGYCGKCGTPLTYRGDGHPGEVHLHISGMAHPERFPASHHVFFDDAQPGFDVMDNLARFGSRNRSPIAWGAQPTKDILFVCTGNSARSILAEAMLNSRSRFGLRAYSAGSRPTGKVHPGAIELLAQHHLDTAVPRSKSLTQFEGHSFKRAITLCDSAAADCPVVPGVPKIEHWGLPDPAAGEVSFAQCWQMLATRIDTLVDEQCRTRD